jgi:AraC-like DNA-binding protein
MVIQNFYMEDKPAITMSHIYIKNMCCDRCIEVVRRLLTNAGYSPLFVGIGEVAIEKALSEIDLHCIREKLLLKGFDIADKSEDKLVIKIQTLLIQYLEGIISGEATMPKKLSVYLTESLHRSYYHLSRIFSTTTGITIEKYFIRLRIEKAKELIIQGVLNMSEIAWKLGYSSQQTLITQFKKETGKTPGEYKANPEPSRINLYQLLPQNFEQHSSKNKHDMP